MNKFAVSRPVKRRTITRSFNGETAKEALVQSGFAKDREAFGFTKGQFSIIDLIDAALSFTGPADATIATWTAADADLRRCAETMRNGAFTSLRWVVDHSFENRQPVFCNAMRDLFGDNAIRTTNSHAKFVLLRSADWRVLIQTSMNLNFNKRIENFWIADDAELFDAYSALVEDVFALQKPGEGFGEGAKKVRAQTERMGKIAAADPFAGIMSFGEVVPKLTG